MTPRDMFLIRTGRHLRKARRRAHLNGTQAGARISVHANTVYNWEGGVARLSLFEFVRYSEALNRKPTELLSEILTPATQKSVNAGANPPCHSGPRAQRCDHDGPGGFMGHTCHLGGNIMRKLALLILAFAVSSACFAAGQTASVNHTITSNWNPAATTVCTSTVTSSCENGQTLTITPPSGAPTTIASCATAGLAANSPCLSVGSASFVFTPGGFLACGTWTVTVVTNGFDQNGIAATSVPISATVVAACPLAPFTIPPATNLGAKTQ
ncbi:MAG TPA: helix-turn-helix transcriptional regulator [Terracidiphilus sp.]|nr:helix-turn-helix transcriptional regulator [Terracidiphilus sp.]